MQDLAAEEDLEETTEQAVLRDETEDKQKSETWYRKHPDVLDSEKLQSIYEQRESAKADAAEQAAEQAKYDEEATAITEPHQAQNILNKPQMAESKKVKGKKRAGLFGWLKKKNKEINKLKDEVARLQKQVDTIEKLTKTD